MDIIDGITKNVAKAAKTATKKTEEVINKGKIKFALANLQSDLDELFEELGRLRYDSVSLGVSHGSKEAAVIRKIDSIKADMEILKAELTKNAKENVCPECSKTVKKGLSFCPFCGEKLNK